MNIRKITLLSLLDALSLGLFALELLIPPFALCPYAKIGLANTVTLFMLTRKRLFIVTDCVIVLAVRCVLSALITGQLMTVAFSLGGGMSALLAMFSVRQLITEKTVVISIVGAVFHNIAQILVSILFYGVFSVFYTVPVLFAAGILCGALTGTAVMLINRNHAFSESFEKAFNKDGSYGKRKN